MQVDDYLGIDYRNPISYMDDGVPASPILVKTPPPSYDDGGASQAQVSSPVSLEKVAIALSGTVEGATNFVRRTKDKAEVFIGFNKLALVGLAVVGGLFLIIKSRPVLKSQIRKNVSKAARVFKSIPDRL